MNEIAHDDGLIETRNILGYEVDIYGYSYEDTKDGEYDFRDAFINGECINIGHPFFENPTDEELMPFVTDWVKPLDWLRPVLTPLV
jgi:hypothetical protein